MTTEHETETPEPEAPEGATPQGEEGSEGATEQEAPEPTSEPVAREDYDAVVERMRAADRRAAANEQRATEAEGERDELRMRAAFDRAALTGERRITDLDAAWRLTQEHRAGLTVNDDGTVEGVERLVAHVADRYPYLVADEAAPTTRSVADAPTTPAPRSTKPSSGVDVGKLYEKYPALRSRTPSRSALYGRR